MTTYSQICATSIFDEVTNSDDTISVFNAYANNPRTIQSHETESDTPRLTFATENGTLVSIWPTQNQTFSVELSFEDENCENGRFKTQHQQVFLNAIHNLLESDWLDIQFLRHWKPN